MAEEKQNKPKIGIGYRVGKLTVEEATPQRRSGYTVWCCRCDCGGEILLDTRYLQRGTITDCGCNGYPPREDLTGRILGRLAVISPLEDKLGYWKCKCECGNETAVKYDYLISGHTKSCGCLQKTQIIENLKLVDGTSVTKLEAGQIN